MIFVMLSGLMAFAGVLSLDVGLWLADRRDAQGDVDAIALAGALELPIPGVTQDSAVTALTISASEATATSNGVDPDTELTLTVLWNNDDSSDDECFAGEGDSQELYVGVRATITRNSQSVFLGLLSSLSDVNDLTEVKVSAIACTGVPIALRGFTPLAIQMNGDCFTGYPPVGDADPILGTRCALQAGGGGPQEHNFAPLGFSEPDCNDSSNSAVVYTNNIQNGTDVTCTVGDSVGTVTGNVGSQTKLGIEALIAGEGDCDSTYFATHSQADLDADNATLVAAGHAALLAPTVNDGVDDFFEIWQLNANYAASEPVQGLSPRDCDPSTSGVQTSPRNRAILVIGDATSGNDSGADCDGGNRRCLFVRGFTRIYLEGCSRDDSDPASATLEREFSDCEGPFNDFFVYGRMLSQLAESDLALGYTFDGDWQTFLQK